MRTPEAVLGKLQVRWRRQRGEWLLGRGEWPLSLATGVPSEHVAGAHWAAFDDWLRRWREEPRSGRLEHAERSWPRLGRQRLPVRWVFESAAEVAVALGEHERWTRACERIAGLRDRWESASPEWVERLPAHYGLLSELPDLEFERLLAVVDFLYAGRGRGLRPRQLPVPGIHSKWVAQYRSVVTDWVSALKGESGSTDFFRTTGVVSEPPRIRLRFLDPVLAEAAGGLADIEAPVDQVSALAVSPRAVLIVENLETGLACERLDGVVVIMGRGYAVECLADIAWLNRAPVVYWGDIDTHGLAILDRVRRVCPQARSVLMDRETLLAHRDMWGSEPRQHGEAALERLEEDERSLYRALRAGEFGPEVRLEQERLPWDLAWPRVRQALGAG